MFPFKFIVRYEYFSIRCNLSFSLFVNSWIAFINIIYITNFVERDCMEVWDESEVHVLWYQEPSQMGFAISFSFAWRQFDDLIGLKNAMEEEGHDADEASLRYGFLELYSWKLKPVMLMLTRLVVWMDHDISLCCSRGICYFSWGY